MAVSGEKSGSHWSPGVWQREESFQATGSARGQHPLRVLTHDPGAWERVKSGWIAAISGSSR